MRLLEVLRKDKMTALKEKDTIRNGVCSLLISAVALAEKEQHRELSDEEAMVYVQKELKQARETLALTPENRLDLIEEGKRKIAILESYLPQQMEEGELQSAILKLMEELKLEPIKKNQGTLMKAMMARYQGKTDGKTVSMVMAKLLK